jgi:iron complex outermembrane receptor protein
MRVLLFIWLMLFSFAISAQDSSDTLSNIDGVEVIASRLAFSSNLSAIEIDEKTLSSKSTENLDQILRDYSGINIKTYGYNGMSNIGMRGSNSNHTAVLWNGINLQNPLNGGVNLSLFPAFLIDEINIQKGGSSALFGSGAMGGSIHLKSNAQFNKGLQSTFYTGIGSFGQYQGGVGVNFSNKIIASNIKFYYKQAKNNFPFENTQQFGHPIQEQTNAELTQYGILQENSLIITKNQKIKTSIWWQKNSQNLPPQMSSLKSEKHTDNESVRGIVDWMFLKGKYNFKIRNASLFSTLIYSDKEISLIAKHRSFSNITEAEYNLSLRKKDKLQIGINNTFEKGFSDSYPNNTQRNRLAIFSSYKWKPLKKLDFDISMREEFVENRFTPLTYSLSANIIDIKGFSTHLQLAKNYRIPTFNDLYWVDGMAKGNPNLKDESSLGEVIEVAYSKAIRMSNFRIGFNAFNTKYTNQIQWVPVLGIWQPSNNKEVWARGIETNIEYALNFNKWRFNLKGNYNYTLSTIEKKNNNESDEIIGKQLIFTPIHNGNISYKMSYKNISLEYLHEFIGERYTTSDNSEWLEAYSIGNIILNYSKEVYANKFTIGLRFNNIWGTVYQSMPMYAMPGRSFEFSLRIWI